MSESEHPIIYCPKTEMNITCSQSISELFCTAASTRILSRIHSRLPVSSVRLHMPAPHCNQYQECLSVAMAALEKRSLTCPVGPLGTLKRHGGISPGPCEGQTQLEFTPLSPAAMLTPTNKPIFKPIFKVSES